jgi:tripartite-type tricarboxylate transporter receptor subunit TctC
MQKHSWKRVAFLLIGLLAAAPAFCQQWPERAVRIIVPFPPGGNTDTIARITADYLAQRFGKPVIVENRPGAGGAIAAEFVAKSPPDGYTLFLATLPQMAILPAMTKTRYDPVKDFAPVSIVGRNMFLLALNPSVPARTLSEFVAYVKGRPEKLPYASGGSGSVSHLSVALLLHRAGIEMIHVPYKGGPPALADVLAGQATLYFGNLTEVTPQARAGKVRVIAVSGEKRAPQFPEVPTVAEQGYPDFRTETWNAIAAPAGTPAAVIKRLAEEIGAAAKDPAIVGRLDNIGVEAVGNSPAEFAKVLEADLKTWGEAVRISGARAD